MAQLATAAPLAVDNGEKRALHLVIEACQTTDTIVAVLAADLTVAGMKDNDGMLSLTPRC